MRLRLLCSVAAWRAVVYSRLEYATAAMLGNWVRRGGPRVLQVGDRHRGGHKGGCGLLHCLLYTR